ncbi:IS30 family transposase, partial [Lentilactobacillus parabuchneri]
MTRIKNIISNQYHQLNLAERGRIESLRDLDWSIRRIAQALHRNPSTISRELKRGTTTQINASTHIFEQSYLAETGEAIYRKHRLNSCYRGLFDHCQTFCNALVTALKARPRMHSVDTFVHQFKTDHPRLVCPSTPTVYRYIDDQRLVIRNSDLPAKLRRRIKCPGAKHHRINKKNLGHSIEERPAMVQARQELGHWEGDLVKGKRVESEPALMTLTERVSRLEIIVKLPNYHADTCLKALQ